MGLQPGEECIPKCRCLVTKATEQRHGSHLVKINNEHTVRWLVLSNKTQFWIWNKMLDSSFFSSLEPITLIEIFSNYLWSSLRISDFPSLEKINLFSRNSLISRMAGNSDTWLHLWNFFLITSLYEMGPRSITSMWPGMCAWYVVGGVIRPCNSIFAENYFFI